MKKKMTRIPITQRPNIKLKKQRNFLIRHSQIWETAMAIIGVSNLCGQTTTNWSFAV